MSKVGQGMSLLNGGWATRKWVSGGNQESGSDGMFAGTLELEKR